MTIPYSTGPNTWGYKRGVIYRVGSDEPIAEIQRNYSSFPHLWIEGHPQGDLFIGGEDYQGQTVLNLSTGERRDHLPKQAETGAGFCWADYRYDTATHILTVTGCHWACPYEYRFYDFSDPMRGWPELEVSGWDQPIEDDDRWPTIDPDGTIRCYQSDLDDDSEEAGAKRLRSTVTFRREGNRLVLLSEWVSDEEKEARQQFEESERVRKAWLAEYRRTDPIYLAVQEELGKPDMKGASSLGVGQTYHGWCPHWEGNENRFGYRLIWGKGKPTVDLEWAHDTGPIKVQVYLEGKKAGTHWYEHSVEAVKQAFTKVREMLP